MLKFLIGLYLFSAITMAILIAAMLLSEGSKFTVGPGMLVVILSVTYIPIVNTLTLCWILKETVRRMVKRRAGR